MGGFLTSRRWLPRVFLLLLLVIGSAAPAPAPAAPGRPGRPGAGAGLIWRLRDGAGTVFLAGSIHALRPERAALPASYEWAYAEAERLTFELDLDDLDPLALSTELLNRAIAPAGHSLRRTAGPVRWEALRRRLAPLGMPEEALDRLEPWAAALLVASGSLSGGGWSSASGVELQLLRRATHDRKPIDGLETPALQLRLFQELPEAAQLAMLDQSLREGEALSGRVGALEAAWRRGDAAELEALLLTPGGTADPVATIFVDRRNAAWLPRIRDLLRRRDDTLVVVGALHLVGERGLIASLRRHGLRVERLGAGPAVPAPAASGGP